MFIRAALLLLLAHAFSVDTFKIEDHHKDLGVRSIENPKKAQEIRKNVGKRYVPHQLKNRKEVPGFEDYMPDHVFPQEYRNPSWSVLVVEDKFKTWDLMSDEEVNKKRNKTAEIFVRLLVASTSMKNNFAYILGVNNLNSVLDPEFFAEICGDGKQLNRYQYMKFVTQSSTLYKQNEITIDYKLLESTRRGIHVEAKFATMDNNGLKVQIEYEFKAKLTFSTEWYFSLIYLKQGGSCANEGKANLELGEGVKDIVAEELEGLKTAPTMKLFFDLFTPKIFKDVEENPYYVPMQWISGLNSSVVQIDVCQDGVTELVKYTVDEFRTWYEKFDIMWHQNTSDGTGFFVQILDLTAEAISARVTMRLQMGLDPNEAEEDWNFKFTGKKMDGVWALDTINVLCTPTVVYKDRSLKSIRDIVAGTFLQELSYLNDTQWSFTPEFIKMFTKHESQVEITNCQKGTRTMINQTDLFIKDKANSHGIRFTKLYLEKKDIPSPPPDMHVYSFDTVGVAADSSSTEEKHNEWSYEIKWDQKDQFYYIFRFGIDCTKAESLKEYFIQPIPFIPLSRHKYKGMRLGRSV